MSKLLGGVKLRSGASWKVLVVCMYLCARACVHVCVCVRAYVFVCVCVCVQAFAFASHFLAGYDQHSTPAVVVQDASVSHQTVQREMLLNGFVDDQPLSDLPAHLGQMVSKHSAKCTGSFVVHSLL